MPNPDEKFQFYPGSGNDHGEDGKKIEKLKCSLDMELVLSRQTFSSVGNTAHLHFSSWHKGNFFRCMAQNEYFFRFHSAFVCRAVAHGI